MLDLHYRDWHDEVVAIVSDVYGMTIAEFMEWKGIKTNALSAYFRLGYSPLETFEEIDSEN